MHEYEPEPRSARRKPRAREQTGSEFHKRRRFLHISQRKLAELATAKLNRESGNNGPKITQDDISDLETGSKDSYAMNIAQLKAIAQALGSPLTAVFNNGRRQTIDLDNAARIETLYRQGGRPTLSTFSVYS